MAERGRWSRALFRRLLRLYPRGFHEWYGSDLEADFEDLVRDRGVRAAWSRVAADLLRSLRISHSSASRERRRVSRLTLGQMGGSAMGTLLFDIRHAVRGLVRAPVFTLVTVGTLALGIGANSAIFSLVNAALLRPLGYHDSDRLMVLSENFPERSSQRGWGVSPPDFEDIVRYQRSFTDVGAYRVRPFELSGGEAPEEINVAQVTEAVFPVLGVLPARGRIPGAEDRSDARVAVISHGLWQRRFGGREVLGERLVLSRQPYTIVGIMPADFEFPKRGPQRNGEPADAWVPLVFTAGERQARGMMYNHTVIGRLRDGVTPAQAIANMRVLSASVREQYPVALQTYASSLTIVAAPLIDDIAGQVRRPLFVLLAAVGLVLLVACANIANLVLGRAVSREREIGVRTALGAARGRLFQMLLTESLVLALLGGSLGLIVGQSVLRAMPAVIATSLPGVSNVSLDGRVVGFALVLSLLTAVTFGLVPLAAGGSRSLNDVLRDGGSSIGGRRRNRLQGGLVVTSVALAFVLLVGAGLLTRSLTRLLAVDPGAHASNVLSLRVTLPFASYNNATAVRSFYQNVRDRIAEIPGVRAVSISTDLPLVSDGERRAFTADSMDTSAISPSVAVTWVHGDYFSTFGIPILTGRTFTAEEQMENRLTAIVSRGLAAQYWPGDDAVGKRVRWGLAEVVPDNPVWMTVVGIAGDVLEGSPSARPVPHIYVPYTEVDNRTFIGPVLSDFYRGLTIAARGHGDAPLAVAPIQSAVAGIDSALAITDVKTMEQVAEEALAPQRFSTTVAASFAVGALSLAALGLYGVLAFGVAQRTREIGVRLALGANAGSVVGIVVRRGMLLTGVGLVVGVAGALAAARLMRTQLYETTASDPVTFVVVFGVLFLVALVACFIPARRATHIDPLVALRTE